MAMGKHKPERQEELWLEAGKMPRSPGHPFYQRLNEILAKHGFDAFAEDLCRRFYAKKMGRPSVAPGMYFRMLLIGYFEGIDSERGIAWRCADSLGLREFLGLALDERVADHSSVSRTRRLLDIETHTEVFTWVLKVLAKEKLLKGKTIGVDATTLEANAALRSIVRRDTGESYDEFLTCLAKASGIETPTRADLKKIDKKRPKKGSNRDWQHPHDPDARITKMKDGRTHLAHKAEHAVDMDTGAIVGITVQRADKGDTSSLPETLSEASEQIEKVSEDEEANKQMSNKPLDEIVLDKGYHSNDMLVDLSKEEIRSYVSEPDRGRRNWKGKQEAQASVYANRRRIRGERGKRLMRKRGELLERAFAHYLRTGAMRRVHLRHHENILKRLLIHVAGFNLSLIMRKLLGRGTPRGLHDLLWALQNRLRTWQKPVMDRIAGLKSIWTKILTQTNQTKIA